MRITLFRALQAINVADDQAAAVVDDLETHVEIVVNNNIKAVEGRLAALEGKLTAVQTTLEARITGLQTTLEGRITGVQGTLDGKIIGIQATLDAMKSQLQFVSVMLGVIGLAIAAGPIVARFIR